MKKLILISLCAVLCVLFCACGENNEESSEASTTASASTAATTATTAGSTTASTAANKKAEKSKPVESSIGGNSSDAPYESAKEAAVAEAKDFLEKANYSQNGLYKELVYMGYAEEDAKYAVDNCGVDWTEQAAKHAKLLVAQSPYSYDNLVEKLESEGFSNDEASAGALIAIQDKNSKANNPKTLSAIDAATKYFDSGNYSYSELIDKLEQDGYSAAEAENAVNNCGADWNALAAAEAKKLLQSHVYTKEELVDKLVFEGYTLAQAAYGAESNGL